MARYTIEIEKFYPGPGLEPGPLALRANALTTRGQVRVHDRINLFRAILSDLMRALARKLKARVQVPVQDRIFLFQFYRPYLFAVLLIVIYKACHQFLHLQIICEKVLVHMLHILKCRSVGLYSGKIWV